MKKIHKKNETNRFKLKNIRFSYLTTFQNQTNDIKKGNYYEPRQVGFGKWDNILLVTINFRPISLFVLSKFDGGKQALCNFNQSNF